MSSTNPLVAIDAATRAGEGMNQDRYAVSDHYAVVLDGASSPDPVTDLDGGWYADQLLRGIVGALDRSPRAQLRDVLAESIQRVAEVGSLVPGRAPSSTVAIVRWDPNRLEGLVLGDSRIVVSTNAGVVDLRDDRLTAVGVDERRAYQEALRRHGGFDQAHRDRLRALVAVQRRYRNQPNGYWIAEADPAAASRALERFWSFGGVNTVVLATDGLSRGVDQIGAYRGWMDLIDAAASHGVKAVIDRVQELEATDPHGTRWPRSKRHDDKTGVVLTLKEGHAKTDRV